MAGRIVQMVLLAVVISILNHAVFISCFVPNELRLKAIGDFSSKSHLAITKKGIKLALDMYFKEKANVTKQDEDKPNQKSTKELFLIYYDDFCQVKLKQHLDAREAMLKANAEVDTDESKGNRVDYHFDAERFHETNRLLIATREQIVEHCQNSNYDKARELLGNMFHTIQDFYSHSNWVELGRSGTNHHIGWDSEGFGIAIASENEPTCKPCPRRGVLFGKLCKDNLITNKLTSGYFEVRAFGDKPEIDSNGKPVPKPIMNGPGKSGKCSHGAVSIDETTMESPKGGINKDTEKSTISPHGHLHHHAANLAAKATADFIMSLRKKITDEHIENILGMIQPHCNPRSQPKKPPRENSKTEQEITHYPAIDFGQDGKEKLVFDGYNIQFHPLITSVITDFSNGPLKFPVDSTVMDLVIELSEHTNTATDKEIQINIIDPLGNPTNYDDKLIQGHKTHVKVDVPERGYWQIEIKENGQISQHKYIITVYADSSFYTSMGLLDIKGSGRHFKPFQSSTRPIQESEDLKLHDKFAARIVVPTESSTTLKNLQFRAPNGAVLQTFTLPTTDKSKTVSWKVDDDYITCEFEIKYKKPENSQEFRLFLKGTDANGNEVLRTSKMVYHTTGLNNHWFKPIIGELRGNRGPIDH